MNNHAGPRMVRAGEDHKMSGMTLNVDDTLVRPVIEAQIQAAVVRELEKMDDILAEMVSKTINVKVDSDGRPRSGRGYGNDETYLEWQFRNAMRGAITRSITEWVENKQPEIQAEIEKQIMMNKSEFAQAVLSALVGAVGNKWRFNVEVNLPKD